MAAAYKLKAPYVGIEGGTHNLSERQDVLAEYLGRMMGITIKIF